MKMNKGMHPYFSLEQFKPSNQLFGENKLEDIK